jgi:RNA polymerase sigma-70 factor (ECF subfamily)
VAEPQRADDAGALAPIAARAKAGDVAAFRALVQATTPRLWRVAVHLLGDRDEADDVVQLVYVRAWGRIGELRDPGAALGWLVGIARNAARDRLRERARRGGRADDAALADVPAAPEQRPDVRLAEAQLGVQVRAALDRLSDEHRLVLLLREVDEMSYDEIAATLGVPVGTVESRLHRARAKLAKGLAPLRGGAR